MSNTKYSLIILLVVSILISTVGFGQTIKLSDLTTYNGNPNGGYLPITIAGSTKKIDARWFGYDNVDSLWISNDTLRYRLKGGSIFGRKIPGTYDSSLMATNKKLKDSSSALRALIYSIGSGGSGGAETDPVWSAVASAYRTKIQNDALYSALSHTHAQSQVSNLSDSLLARYTKAQSDARYLQSFSEADPVWTAVSSTYRTKTQNDALYAALSHTHPQSDVTNLSDSLLNRYTKSQADARYLQSFTETDPIWTGVASSYRTKTQNDALYAALVHNHNQSQVNNLSDSLLDRYTKAQSNARYALASHIHSQTDIIHLADSLTSKINVSDSGVTYITPAGLSSATLSSVTASSATTFTNKSGNISQWSNDQNYITKYQRPIRTITASTGTVSNSDGDVLVDATSNNITLTINAASTFYSGSNSMVISIVQVDNSTNTVTLNFSSTINGVSSITLAGGDGFSFSSNSSTFFIRP